MIKLEPRNPRIRPYLEQALRLCPNIRVMKRIANNDTEAICSSWIMLKNWSFKAMGDPTDIELMSSELVFETDINSRLDNKNLADIIMSHLQSEDIGYECWFSGNKSYHVYCSFPYLERLEFKHVSLVKELLAKRIAGDIFDMLDPALFKSKAHMLSIRGGVHPITKKNKEIVGSFKHTKFNRLPIEIIEEAKHIRHKIDDICKLVSPVPKLCECGLIDIALTRKLPSGNRECLLLPNFLALNPNPDTIRKFSRIQGMPIAQVCSWRRSGCYRGYFSCRQMKSFALKAGLIETCKKCKHYI
jgi:hypothetical protein